MKDSDLTPWFSGDVKPVRMGPYVRRIAGTRRRDWWDGDQWMTGFSFIASMWQHQPWRVLTKEAHDRMTRKGK